LHTGKRRRGTYRGRGRREEGEREEDLNSGGMPMFNVPLQIRLGFEDLVTV
jgi:hypothetical protein